MSSLQRSPADIREQFSKNLRSLTEGEKSASATARALGVNRTQLGRFLSGEAIPRPDLLHRIAQHYDLDARMLTEPLDELRAAQGRARQHEMLSVFTHFKPASHSIVPDGYYAEWMPDWLDDKKATVHILVVTTEPNGQRRIRTQFAARGLTSEHASRHAKPQVQFSGPIFAQGTGFVTFDKQKDDEYLAMTVYKVGFLNQKRMYPGYKLSSVTSTSGWQRSRSPVVMKYLGNRLRDVLPTARLKINQKLQDIPSEIGLAMKWSIETDRSLFDQVGLIPG